MGNETLVSLLERQQERDAATAYTADVTWKFVRLLTAIRPHSVSSLTLVFEQLAV